jgi:putative Mn2+ efflux pump MntP
MSWIILIGVAVGLAMDAFATSIAVSVSLGGLHRRQVFRLAFHFGLFQALMPVIGWMAGSAVTDRLAAWDHWVAFALLAFVGARAILTTDDGAQDNGTFDPTRGLSLVILSIATSLDALAVGLSFGALGVRILVPSLVIGVTAGALTVVGMVIGHRLGRRFGRRAEIVGGLVLIAIGVWIVVDHTLLGGG